MSERDEWIARKAYELWEQAGRPDGHHHEHWQEASDDWTAEHPDTAPAGDAEWNDEEDE